MMMWVWIGLIGVFGLLEAMTAQLVSIWFVIGSIVALGTSFFGATTAVQVAVFIVVSALALVITRPIVKRFTRTKVQATNADSYIGLDAVVTEEINNIMATGTVRVKGIEWTARSSSDDKIEKGAIVTVRSIEGVKLIVEKKS
jgi:membrane protein implicated in regulation of membrane protease activity